MRGNAAQKNAQLRRMLDDLELGSRDGGRVDISAYSKAPAMRQSRRAMSRPGAYHIALNFLAGYLGAQRDHLWRPRNQTATPI